jgi:UDP-3-O-[3-hydroxymyristoyl] glucosamine N-acyltransferase
MAGHHHYIPSSALPISVSDAVALIGGKLVQGAPDAMITHASMLDNATNGAMCFAEHTKAFARIADIEGVTCLTNQDTLDQLTETDKTKRKHPLAIIIVDRPKDRFAVLMATLYPAAKSTGRIHAMSSIADDAVIGKNVQIDAFVAIASKAVIGDNSIIKSGAVIGENVIIGQNVLIMPQVHIEHAAIGDHVQISPGSVIGNTGFGISGDGQNRLAPHIGKVIIGDHCYIGSLNTIDRGMLGDTSIGAHVMTDSRCHIAHNVKIGKGNIICAKVGFAGSVTVGERNIFGPEVGVASHVTIGSGNLFASRCGVTKDITNGHVLGGFPAVAMSDYRLQVAALRRLARELKSKAGKE